MARIKKVTRSDCLAQITDQIILFRTLHYGKSPDYVYMTSALLKMVAGSSKADKERLKFGIVNIRVYDGDELEFYLVDRVCKVQGG